jgi:hypothetical protein
MDRNISSWTGLKTGVSKLVDPADSCESLKMKLQANREVSRKKLAEVRPLLIFLLK